jgi:hypothetical protein
MIAVEVLFMGLGGFIFHQNRGAHARNSQRHP